jgi:hypothetical protein
VHEQRSPCCETAELTSLLRSFHAAAPVPEASPWRGETHGGFGLSIGQLKTNNLRKEDLRIPASSRRIPAIPGTVWFEPGNKYHLLSELFKFLDLEFSFVQILEIWFLGLFVILDLDLEFPRNRRE